jgi:predicted nucleotidyltransferase
MAAILADNLAVVCRRHRVDSLYVFGSRSREISQKVLGMPSQPDAEMVDSDVDIGVLPAVSVQFNVSDKARLMADLEDLLQVGRVDLVVLPEASSDLAFEIIKGECLFDANPDRSAEYELYVMRRAGDLAPYLQERAEAILTDRSAT